MDVVKVILNLVLSRLWAMISMIISKVVSDIRINKGSLLNKLIVCMTSKVVLYLYIMCKVVVNITVC